MGDTFPSGDDCPIAHPGCRCAVVAYFEDNKAEDEEDADSEDDEAEEAAE